MTTRKEGSKKDYEAPRLAVIGSVHDLTLGAQAGSSDGTLPKNIKS